MVRALVFDAAMKRVSASDRVGLAQLLDAEAARPDRLAAVDEGEAHTGHVEHLHSAGHEVLEGREPLLVQRVRFLPGEGLALVALGPEALQGQTDRPASLFEGRLGPVEENHRPGVPGAPGHGLDHGPLIGRRLVLVDLPLLPAVPSRLGCRELQRPFEGGPVGGPPRGDRGVGVFRLHVDDHHVRVRLRRIEDDHRALRRHRPSGGNHESGAGRSGARRVLLHPRGGGGLAGGGKGKEDRKGEREANGSEHGDLFLGHRGPLLHGFPRL